MNGAHLECVTYTRNVEEVIATNDVASCRCLWDVQDVHGQ